jgi:hypothetical protein
VHFLFAADHSLAGAQCVRTVQPIVHVSPLMLLVIYSETVASRQQLICTKQLNTPFFPKQNGKQFNSLRKQQQANQPYN